jgi:hypothetical protein
MSKLLLPFCLGMMMLAGCETATDTSFVPADTAATGTSTSTDTGSTTDGTTTTDTSSADGFAYSAVIWGGESYAGDQTVDMSLNSADVGGGYIRFDFNMNNSWPLKDGNQAVACMFMKRADGSWYGGKWDWISNGGQSLKLTENIDDGYGAFASERPYSGQTVAFVWVSTDKRHRSNEAITTWE